MAIKALNGVTATGAGTAFRLHGADKVESQISFTNAGGSCTALVVTLEGTNNNKAEVDGATAKWDTLGTKTFAAGEITAALGTLSVVNICPEFGRLNVTTLTDTGTTTINAWVSASKAGIKMV